MSKNIYPLNQSILYEIIDYLSKQIDLNKEITTPKIELKYNDLEKFYTSNPMYRQIINDFIIILKKNYSEVYLKNFYNNINELKIKNKKSKVINGQYKIDKNEILIREDAKVSNIRGVLYHELFHMASSAYNNGRRYSGFSQRTKSRKKVIGNGINEGYTELLAHRYTRENFDIAYVDEYNIAMAIETIVGKEEMAKLYFNADLKGLIDKLKEYSDEYEISEFIISVDSLQKKNKIEYKQNKEIIYTFLLKSYTKQQEIEYMKNNINKQEFIDRIGEYINLLKLDKLTAKYILETALNDCMEKESINKKVYSIYTERY